MEQALHFYFNMERDFRKIKFNTFPIGPNGFRIVDGQELTPSDPTHTAQIMLDELVQIVGQHGCPKSSTVDGETSKPVFETKKRGHGMKPNRVRQTKNLEGYTGPWRNRWYIDGNKSKPK